MGGRVRHPVARRAARRARPKLSPTPSRHADWAEHSIRVPTFLITKLEVRYLGFQNLKQFWIALGGRSSFIPSYKLAELLPYPSLNDRRKGTSACGKTRKTQHPGGAGRALLSSGESGGP
jgi:hypothetical protein